MPPTRVAQAPKASTPRIIRASRIPQGPPVEYDPDLVRVRATARGYYAVREVMKDPRDNVRRIVRNDVIRNPGDVFDMDTADMRTLPLGNAPKGALTQKEHPHAGEYGTTEIETDRGQFELPSWVVLADEAGVDTTEPSGHQTTFGKKDGAVL